MNLRQKKIITTAAGIANIAFTIAVSATATFAWFYNSPATAQGISVQCAIPDSRLSWEILKYDDDLKAGVSSTKTEDFYLEQYDEYISQRNIHSNVILRATMTYGDNELFDNNKQLYVDISCLDNPVLTDSKVNKFTSNVCQFKATVVNYVTNDGNTVVVNKAIDELSADTKYTTATSFFANSTSSTSFLTVNNDTPNKDRDNKIAIIPYFDCGNDLVKQMTVYVECSYKDKLVKYYRSTWGMSETGEIKLKGDINDFNFRVGEKYNGSYVQVRNSSEITSGDYMITYDNYSAAMDGSLGPESKGNMKMDQASNYIPVEPRKGRIRNNETNYNSRFNYNGEYLKSASGYNVGRTSNTTNGLNVNNLTANKASLTYDTKSHVYGSADPKPELKFNTTKNVTRFNFYTSETASSQQDITLYKYNEEASYDVYLVSIAVSGQRESFPINSAFEFGGVITATYSDDTTSPINSNLCTFTGFDLSADIPTQTVTVTYEEEGYVASTSYQIAITKDPYIKLDYTRLVGVSGSSYTITASYYFLASEPTYTWTVANENIATIAPTNNTVRVTLKNTGSTTISCSATGVNNPVNCSVTVSSSTNAYTLVTDASTLKAGDKIVIAEKSKNALAGTINVDYLASIEGKFDNNTVTWTKDGVYEFTLGGSAGSWTLANSKGELLGATAVKKVAFGKGETTWSITIVNGNATIQNVTETNGRFLYNSSSPRFTTYTSATASNMLLPQIYRLETGSSATREIIGIEVSSTKTQYFTDDDFVEPTVTVKYSDATSEVINTGYTIDSRDLSTPGKKTITVTYSGFDDSYDIYITKSTLTGISVTPHKTNYYVGDNFSSEDVTVIASYSSTKQKEVTPTSVSGFNNKASGTQKIKITYTEGDISFSETYEITMNPVVLTSIEITKNPTKMTYNVKDNFDISGMIITAHYDNDSTKEVQNEVTYEKTLSNSSISSITFTYEENGVIKEVTLTGIVVNQATLTPSQESITGTATNEITNLSVTPDHFSGEVIYEWTSEDKTVAAITNNETTYKPTILLKKKGTTTLTCYATDGAQDASTTIQVKVNDSSISLDKTTLNITKGNKATITATIEG
ncbi:MAG: bacterial Ig-like domain-containing protein, partial [Bacilli bacterium]|nr:bacterial Ig-like domain-containing protein [Bacilli bacterium]